MSNNIIKIVTLPSMTVASFHFIGENPEMNALNLLKNWIDENKIAYDEAGKFQCYGFNNPNPTEDNKIYGYEVWLTVGDEYKGKGLNIKEFSGGMYAVMTCRGVQNIYDTWQKFCEWMKNSKYKTGTHQWLEHIIDLKNTDYENVILDLYCPISE